MLKLPRFAPVFLFAASIFPAFSQQKVDMRNTHERLYLAVPIVGSGTPDDPRRPLYVPAPVAGAPPARDGIIAFAFQESDDGKSALVQLVARDRAAFNAIFEDNRADVKLFEKGKDSRSDIETEFRKYKKNFDLDTLSVSVP
jgi:hypothetical protein